jgi:glycogen operon protein
MGAAWIEAERAYNFSLYAQHAESVVQLLFAEGDLARPLLEFRLDPRVNKTWRVWHCRLGGDVGAARYYAYRIDGPRAAGPGLWHAYDPEKIRLDPCARELFFSPDFDRQAARRPGSNLGKAPLGVLPRPGPSPYTVQDRPPRHEPDDAILYEMHVRGFTRSPNSGVAPEWRGTFAGVIDKVAYLKELGITMVELLPVQQFDPQEGNYWGYMTLNFFAQHADYVGFRKSHPSLGRPRFWRDDVHWYGVGPDVDLSFDSHSLAYCLHGASRGDCDLYVMINALPRAARLRDPGEPPGRLASCDRHGTW